MRIFSTKNRAAHLGPFPLERLPRTTVDQIMADLIALPETDQLNLPNDHRHIHLASALSPALAMLDLLRAGDKSPGKAQIPADPELRSKHLKGAGYFLDAGMIGICKLPESAHLEQPYRHPGIAELSQNLGRTKIKTFSTGIEQIMADLKQMTQSDFGSIGHHSHAIVFLFEHPRDPKIDEPGGEWLINAGRARSALRAAEPAVTMANYLRMLGYDARAHSLSSSDVCLNKLALACGLCQLKDRHLSNPFVDTHFGLSAITTDFELAVDAPLHPDSLLNNPDWKWLIGYGSERRKATAMPYAKRDFHKGALPFEKIRRVDHTTTFIDETRIPRVPKRADMFARARFGDFGPKIQAETIDARFASKSPVGAALDSAGAAFILLQYGKSSAKVDSDSLDPRANADKVKAALYFLGVDAVGISRCPEWAWYSHDAEGEPIEPGHDNAISIMIDQGRDTMEGASGDDWISYMQSIRAYLRGQILCSVAAELIRRCGYEAEVHSAMQGNVLQPPLSLLAGLGEVSRIGEVILHPLLGPRLKTTIITTDMPMAHDKPIDFGLQNFCENCNKCARECPSGAITAGPKVMFNGYEIYKSDSQRCLQYRLTNQAGSMCGRCMKTCPWNLEGLFKETPFRWLASNIPQAAKALAKLDDLLANGSINPVKKWWWDIERNKSGEIVHAAQTNRRGLQIDLDLKPGDQTLGVYPAPLTPHPYPAPEIADREAAIEAFKSLVSAREYQARLARGETKTLVPAARVFDSDPPVIRTIVSNVVRMSANVTKFELVSAGGQLLPPFQAGAHIDVVISPEFFRQYSLAGDPADRSKYIIGVLRENEGRGGSKLLHRIFEQGRNVFISRPVNHFELNERAEKTLLMAGGIGITPMMAMAYRLSAIDADFELHYSCSSRNNAGFVDDMANMSWASKVHQYFSDNNSRAELSSVIPAYTKGMHLYTCGPDRYMSAVLETASQLGWTDEALHQEYFSTPVMPEYENHPFVIRLIQSDKRITVASDQSAAEALIQAGIKIDLKCRDGICGVCQCELIEGEVDHRDFVLSKSQRRHSMITCQSRARHAHQEITLNL